MMPERLQEIITEFAELDDREKLEYLLYFAEGLPPLPEWLLEDKEKMEAVPECMTPVFVFAEESDGNLIFHFDVPDESPTVRGYAAIMSQGLRRALPEQILAVPDDFYISMGLQKVLSGQRINGLTAILGHMKRLAAIHSRTAS